MTNHRSRFASLVLITTLSSGCSLLGIERLPGGYRRDRTPTCSEAAMPVAMDIAVSALSALGGATMVATSFGENPDDKLREAGMIYGIFSLVTAGSAWYGVRNNQRCAQAREAHRDWIEEARRAMPPGTNIPQ